MMMNKSLKYVGVFLLLCVLTIASRTSKTITLVVLASVGTLAFAKYLSMWVLEKDEGTMEMIEVADAIRAGASGFFSTQYGLISKLAVVCAAFVFFLYEFRQVTPEQEKSGLTSHSVAILTTVAFLLGAFCSGMSGYAGMWVSVRANSRVAAASRRGSREPLVVALRQRRGLRCQRRGFVRVHRGGDHFSDDFRRNRGEKIRYERRRSEGVRVVPTGGSRDGLLCLGDWHSVRF